MTTSAAAKTKTKTAGSPLAIPAQAARPTELPQATGAQAGKVDLSSLRAQREARGLSRAQLALRLGVSAGAIQSWETGSSAPRGANAVALQAFLGAGESSGAPAEEAPAPAVPSAASPAAAAPRLVRPSHASEAAARWAAEIVAAYLEAGNRLSREESARMTAELCAALAC